MKTRVVRLLLVVAASRASALTTGAAQEMLECECDKVRCTCTKACSCMVAGENGGMFLQTMELPALAVDAGSPAPASFLEAGAPAVQLDRCDCKKVSCNCLKRCECAIKFGTGMQAAAAASAAALVQVKETDGSLPAAGAAAAAPEEARRSRHRRLAEQ
jgi:hypothetical protein